MAVYATLKGLHELHRFDYIEFPEYRGEGYFALRAKRTLGHFEGAVLGVRLHTPLYLCREQDLQDSLTLETEMLRHMELRSAAYADLLLSASRSMMERMLLDVGERGAVRRSAGSCGAAAPRSHRHAPRAHGAGNA